MTVSPKLIRQFLLWLVIGIALYGTTVVVSGWPDIRSSLAALGLSGWVAVIGLSTLNIVVRFVRWQFYLGRLNHHVPMWSSLAYFIAGFAFIGTPAKAGEAVRSVYLKQHGVGYADSLAALFVERLTDLIAVVLLAMSAALAFERMRWPVIIAALVTLALLPVVHSQVLRNLLRALQERLGPGRVGRTLGHLLDLLGSSAALLRSGPLYIGMFLSIIAAVAICSTMYLTLGMLGFEVSPFIAIGIYAAGILVGALSFLPGGIGSAEAVMGLGLLIIGFDPTLAISAILICRIAGMWYPISIGLVSVIGLEFGQAGVMRDATEAERSGPSAGGPG